MKPADAELERAKERVLASLPGTVRQIADRTGYSTSRVYSLLRQLGNEDRAYLRPPVPGQMHVYAAKDVDCAPPEVLMLQTIVSSWTAAR